MSKNLVAIGIIMVIVGVGAFIYSEELYRSASKDYEHSNQLRDIAISSRAFAKKFPELANPSFQEKVSDDWISYKMRADQKMTKADIIRYGLGTAGGAVGLILLLAGLLRKPDKSA